ncbi:MAG: HupE/UreJ family protein [Gemmatimonadetes bacterium]|nr:HupE/UreJ family protein [Gemmatimonadota bacterium]
MSDFLTFAGMGFHHITDLEAADHILFLLALAAIYRFRDWREVTWVVTAFTVGHSITLGLAVTRVVDFPEKVIEFLIPVTIVATAVENLLVRDRAVAPLKGRYRPVFAGVFGLVHGAGFANYLRALFMDDIALPLFGFNVGIEVGQLTVLCAIAVALALIDRTIGAVRSASQSPTPFRLRVITVSMVVALVAARWAVERNPW